MNKKTTCKNQKITDPHTLAEKKKFVAKIYNNPVISSSLIVRAMHKNPETGVEDILSDMLEQIDGFKEKSTIRVETILLSQVHALQSIFERAALQVGNPASIEALQAWGVIALKAQEQTRKTLATLMDIKNPKQTSFIKQQNNAVNQQINNQDQNSKILEKKPKNELLEAKDDLDTRTPFKTITVNPQMEAVAKIDRSQDRGRKSN